MDDVDDVSAEKDRGATWEDLEEGLFLLLIFGIPGLLYVLVVRPLQSLFRLKTERFKFLRTLRLDALSRELISGRDYVLFNDKKEKATEWELQTIAYHISELCALGAVKEKEYREVFRIFPLSSFWVHRNGYTERRLHTGVAIGFYLGVSTTVFINWLV